MSRWRERLKQFVLLPLVVVAVVVLAYFTFRTTLQIDTLRQQSVLEATLALATQKANRVDRQIIDQDNVVVAVPDPARSRCSASAGCRPRSARRRACAPSSSSTRVTRCSRSRRAPPARSPTR